MSEPKRWFVTLKDQIQATDKSIARWFDLPKRERMELVVRYEDYARLKAEAVTKDYLITQLKAEVERLKSLKAELKVGVTSEGEKPDQSDKDFKITIGFNSLEEFERDVASARQLIPEIIALANLSKGGQS